MSRAPSWREQAPAHSRELAAPARTRPTTRGTRGTCAGPLLDDLVGSRQNRGWNREPERLGGLHVDHELELGGPLNRQVTSFCAFEDLVHNGRSAAVILEIVRSVADQATSVSKLSSSGRRKPSPCRQLRHRTEVAIEHRI